ncbi:ferredoxin [Streptomyces sp. DG2A-72]|uniref:ferredoxin n=1 Tax=Streptomyces sp. DG2A-72 TaxID=3051386 RepID=UPI00265B9EB8|nr:ferredoxin [Streptomyces sp. DG2A-72]MDO0939328.1 ferredoxin [Streptomyces sp. DG2A-72]
MKATLRLDRKVCAGAGLCAAMDPTHFQLAADGRATLLVAELADAEAVEAAQDVIDCCPSEAISLAETA